ncbi:MAG: ATP-binding protein [Deltaproteobacteria bacterium]|nr:MAG: ATP-binding protein [Deltaproteobacteria bacterium]
MEVKLRLLSYKYKDVDENQWSFSKIEFGKINLLVGATSSGKSRLLNTIFNLGKFVAAKEFKKGSWDIIFERNSKKYRWQLEAKEIDTNNIVERDIVSEFKNSEEFIIIDRDLGKFLYKDKELPKLSKDETSVTILKDEDDIKNIYKGFSSIRRRNFDLDALSAASSFDSIPIQLINDLEKKKDLEKIRSSSLSLSSVLFLFQKYFPSCFMEICDYYKSIFPFISEISIRDLGQLNKNLGVAGKVPVFCIKERNVDTWITLEGLSSGMKKVLIILTDIYILPEGSIYLIDEYENSLGINAVEFLPNFLLELNKDIQFFITSHHPYIINKIPVKDWYVFHRTGSEVSIKYGEELTQRFGKSKHQVFTQLINDPYFKVAE